MFPRIGETVQILNKTFFIYDMDSFTKEYYRSLTKKKLQKICTYSVANSFYIKYMYMCTLNLRLFEISFLYTTEILENMCANWTHWVFWEKLVMSEIFLFILSSISITIKYIYSDMMGEQNLEGLPVDPLPQPNLTKQVHRKCMCPLLHFVVQ